jgi:phosphatidylinositol alpha-1,6-mannosyltransferase
MSNAPCSPERRATPAAGSPAGVLLLSELFPPAIGGSAELLWNVYSRIDGFPVTVLTNDSGVPFPAHDAGALEIHRRPMTYTRWGILHAKALGRHLHIAAATRQLSSTASVVHCGRALPEGLDALLAGLATRRPYICWTHGEELAFVRSSRELTWLMHLVFRRAAAVVANSRNTAAQLEQWGAPIERVHVIYPGVDTVRFQPGRQEARALRARLARPGELLLLTVGRLQRRKGHDHVIEALAGMTTSHPNLRYLIVGDGEERAALEQLVVARSLTDRVTFAGSVPASELPAYYGAADLFVHPNRLDGRDFEGFGMVFLEAAAAGLPVIGGATGGVPEAVAAGRTGLLVSGTCVDELRTALARLADSAELRQSMGRQGRARAQAEFSWSAAARKIASLHDRVTNTPR